MRILLTARRLTVGCVRSLVLLYYWLDFLLGTWLKLKPLRRGVL